MKTLLNVLFVLLISMQIQAQEKRITGIISDENGLPIPGVNIIVKGTSTGTQTDFDGKYTITANLGDVISFSSVGYKRIEKTVGESNTISFAMEVDSSALDEVVITGYGIKRKKHSVSHSVSSITAESKLSGKTSGIVIRGTRSVSKDESLNNNTSYGVLTAGEINDICKWEEWKTTLKNKEFKQIQTDWNFVLENKIQVLVKDEKGTPIPNISVTLSNDANTIIMKAKTDYNGEAILFKDLNSSCEGDFYTVQVQQKNKIEGRKVNLNHKTVAFVLENEKPTNNIDVMFTVDATGSMGDEMNYLKAELKNIISRLDKSIEKKRVALTFYRDKGDDYVVKDFDFSTDINLVKETLVHQSAGGGGDYEEAVEEALKVSMSKSWDVKSKSKLLFLLLDAPPHLTQENVATIKEQIKLAQQKGIKIIPIVASDANKNVEFLMRFFSIATNGTYVFLTDDSGIGNTHLKPSTSDFKVEKLNDLIVRLIEKYSGVVS